MGKLVKRIAFIRCLFLPCLYESEFFHVGLQRWITCCDFCGDWYMGRNKEITK